MENLNQERLSSTPELPQLSDLMSLLEMGNTTFLFQKEAERLFDLRLWEIGF